MSKRTIAVDFDGVIHSYVSGWKGAAVVPDPPVPGAIEWLNEVVKDCDIVIHSTRARHVGGGFAIAEYLEKHGFKGVRTESVSITAEKPKAVLYIDDRAWVFRGRFPSLEEIERFKPWKMNTIRDLNIVRGLPGSGKTHFVNNNIERIKADGTCSCVVSSADLFWLESDGTYRFDKSLIGDAHAWAQGEAILAMRDGVNFVFVDNTHSRRWEWSTLETIGRVLGYRIQILDLYDGGLTDEQLAARNVHGVTIEMIAGMRARWQRGGARI